MVQDEGFIDLFYDLLNEQNLNRWQFAEKSGIPYPTVIGWTNHGRLPDFNALKRIADFFDCSVDYLTGRVDDYAQIKPKRKNYFNEELLGQKYIDVRELSEEDIALVKNLVIRLKKSVNKSKS